MEDCAAHVLLRGGYVSLDFLYKIIDGFGSCHRNALTIDERGISGTVLTEEGNAAIIERKNTSGILLVSIVGVLANAFFFQQVP